MFTDNKDFYPTPQNLIDKMLDGLDWKMIHTVLEPSAGKGNIVEALKKKEDFNNRWYTTIKLNIDCIENDANLRAVLKEKDFRVVHDDFLTYDTMKEYDLIIMNPPFSNGCKHLLKALEMQQRNGGAVICLLNAETLKNECNNERIMLNRMLEEYNADIQYIQDAFMDAERKTNVEIALIKVKLPDVQRDSFIFDSLEKAKEQREYTYNTGNTQLAENDFLKAIVEQYKMEIEAGVKLIKEYYAMSPHILYQFGKDKQTGQTIQTGGCVLNLSIGKDSASVNGYIREIRGKYWSALFDNPKFIGQLTNNLQREYYNKVEELKDYEFSLLDKEEKSEHIARQLSIIKNRTFALKQLVEELFRYTTIISDTENSVYTETVINNVLEDCISSYYAIFKEKGITPNINLCEQKIVRSVDKTALLRIFNNVIDNAIKYSEGDLTISLFENGKIVFSNHTSDLNEIQIGKLFDRFYTVNTARKSTGLGLSIAKALIEKMDGNISADYSNNVLSIIIKLNEV